MIIVSQNYVPKSSIGQSKNVFSTSWSRSICFAAVLRDVELKIPRARFLLMKALIFTKIWLAFQRNIFNFGQLVLRDPCNLGSNSGSKTILCIGVFAETDPLPCISRTWMFCDSNGDNLVSRNLTLMLFSTYITMISIYTIHFYTRTYMYEHFHSDHNKLHFGEFSYEPFLCVISLWNQVYIMYEVIY